MTYYDEYEYKRKYEEYKKRRQLEERLREEYENSPEFRQAENEAWKEYWKGGCLWAFIAVAVVVGGLWLLLALSVFL